MVHPHHLLSCHEYYKEIEKASTRSRAIFFRALFSRAIITWPPEGREMAKDWKKRINIDPAIMGGKPVIAGRRVPVQVIVGALAGGDSVEQICDDYRLERQDVLAALAYAAEMLRLEPVHALPG
jgi:uncharacterized protein (DUF433 family)